MTRTGWDYTLLVPCVVSREDMRRALLRWEQSEPHWCEGTVRLGPDAIKVIADNPQAEGTISRLVHCDDLARAWSELLESKEVGAASVDALDDDELDCIVQLVVFGNVIYWE